MRPDATPFVLACEQIALRSGEQVYIGDYAGGLIQRFRIKKEGFKLVVLIKGGEWGLRAVKPPKHEKSITVWYHEDGNKYKASISRKGARWHCPYTPPKSTVTRLMLTH